MKKYEDKSFSQTLAMEYFLEIHMTLTEVNILLVQKKRKKEKNLYKPN